MKLPPATRQDLSEALGAGVVVATAGPAHGADDLDLCAQRLHLAVAELTAAVGVKDGASARAKSRHQRVG